jgi:tetratricopeptide (TPR) repeat protein
MDVEIAQAEALLGVGRAQDAKPILADYLVRNPDLSRALCLMALCHQAQREYRAMLNAANGAAQANPRSEFAYRLRSEALAKLGRPAPALEAARQAVEIAPQFWATHITLAHRLVDQDTRRSRLNAYEAARQALILAPDRPEGHIALARVYSSIGDIRRARHSYRQALAIDPENVVAMHNLGIHEVHSGRIRAGAGKVRDAVAADPQDRLFQHNTKFAARIWLWHKVSIGSIAFAVGAILEFLLAPVALIVAASAVLAAYLAYVLVSFFRLDRLIRSLVLRNRPEQSGARRWYQLSIASFTIQVIALLNLATGWDNSLIGLAGTVVVFMSLGRLRDRGLQALRRMRRRWSHREIYTREIPRPREPSKTHDPVTSLRS